VTNEGQQARFVVLEGGDGSGKSTQVTRLAERIRGRGHTVCTTFEPGATATGAALRDVLLHGRDPIAAVTEALLMAADRAQHVADVVAPALARGEWVVSDRFLPSSLVYQGVVRGLGVDVVRVANDAAVDGVRPDLVVVLDVPEAQARARRDGVPDRLEAEAGTFHMDVAAAYRELAASEGWVLVDGTGTPDEVAARVEAVVVARLAP
jgi:dTMP kinase